MSMTIYNSHRPECLHSIITIVKYFFGTKNNDVVVYSNSTTNRLILVQGDRGMMIGPSERDSKCIMISRSSNGEISNLTRTNYEMVIARRATSVTERVERITNSKIDKDALYNGSWLPDVVNELKTALAH